MAGIALEVPVTWNESTVPLRALTVRVSALGADLLPPTKPPVLLTMAPNLAELPFALLLQSAAVLLTEDRKLVHVLIDLPVLAAVPCRWAVIAARPLLAAVPNLRAVVRAVVSSLARTDPRTPLDERVAVPLTCVRSLPRRSLKLPSIVHNWKPL